MPKSSRKQMIVDEKKVIAELQKNSTESAGIIAKNCACSRQKVRRIIKKLEKNKTIWGYQAVVDDEKLDVKRYQILLKKSTKPVSNNLLDMMLEKDMREQLEKFGVGFDYSFYTHGYFDWSLCITAPDIRAMKKFIEILNTKFKDYISEIQVLEVIFPLLKSGFDNPNLIKIREFFASE